MALQHFYSRVPARVSIYNKADGFDTFAQSASLEQEFVKRELAPACENKLSRIDASAIRQNKMPSVYTQYTTRTGNMIQGCISYLPVDYTGERSAYLSHCLILSEDEMNQILSARSNNALNPGLFVQDISGFQITAPDAAPNKEYPCIAYSPSESGDPEYLLSQFSEDTVKSFLYAVLYCVCGKGRNVCFKLPGEDLELSLRSVHLFNEVVSILPKQLRTSLSFASYVTDPTQYANCRLRGVSAGFPENSAKCVYIDFETDLILGVHHDEVVANKSLLHFFYQLLENQALRTEFLMFMERAADAIPGLQSLNLKVLGNLVFLFQSCSGAFPEQQVIPNDIAVYDFLCAYEKYREALSEEYRLQGCRCLLRYPTNHCAIPKNIFSKVSRLYATETRCVKHMVMNIVLELIHTDVMRDKLFTFIRNNYEAEEEDMKQIIIADLSRVFYGGFLQNQLLSFFSDRFAEEPESSQTLILEKLLLSIRTPALQTKILGFIDQHYHCLSKGHKDRFYNTFMEMLPECDALAAMMIRSVNRHLERESEDRKAELAQCIISALDKDCQKEAHNMMPLLADTPGFTRDLVIRQVFGPWRKRKVRGEYMAYLNEKTVAEKTEALVGAFSLVTDLDFNNLLTETITLYQKDAENGDLYLWLQVARQVDTLPPEFADGLNAAVIEPAICRTVCDVFDTERRTDGMMLLADYTARHPRVRENDQYHLIDSYNRMITAAKQQDYKELDRQLSFLLMHPEHLPQMATYLGECELDPQTQSGETLLCLEFLQNVLRDGSAGIGKLYRKSSVKRTAEEAMTLLLSVCIPMSQAGSTLSSALTAPNSGLKEFVAAFVNGYGKGAYHRLRNALPQETAFGVCLEEALYEHKKTNGSFLAKLFGKR